MKFTVISAIIVSAVVGAVSGKGVSQFYLDANPPRPELRAMVVKNLSYDDKTGLITQQVFAVGADSIAATWAAKIERGGHILCSGGGSSVYSNQRVGRPVSFSPQDWTESPVKKCPDRLKPGDILSATWEHKDGLGLLRSVSRRVTVKPKGTS